MLNCTVQSNFNGNKASLRLQLSRIGQVLLLLIFLPSLVGMQPTRVNAAPSGNEPAVGLNDAGDCVPVKIMPLGDSITYDYHDSETRPSSERTGYRLPLWEQLIAGGYSVDFVGSRVAGDAVGQDLVPPFDPDNEGHPSWTDNQIASNIYNWLVATPAEVVLLHIGTNALDTSPGEVETILNEIDRWEADTGNQVTVLLARIINRASYSADTTAFNNNVAAMAQARIDAGDEIIVIDMENGAGLNYGVDSTPPYDDGDIYDYLHPNDGGYAKMAAAWLNGDSSGSRGLADFLPVCSLPGDIPQTLAVSRSGTGTGTVTSSPAGIDCGSDCTEDYALDMVGTLSAVAGPGSAFTGWSGANAAELVGNGDGTWNLTMHGDKAVTADFSLLPALEPLGHWEFDESSWAGDCSTTDIVDSSGHNRHGTACKNGDAPVPVPGIFGNSGRFDGINQYANMGPGFNFTSSFTVAMWIALDDYDSCGPAGMSQHIIGTHHLRTPTGNGRGWGIYWDCDGLAWELTNSTGSAIESYGFIAPAPFPANGSWHHAALVYDSGIPSATLYWDGVPVYSESGVANVPSFLFNNGEPLTINGLPYAPGAGAPGKIDDARVYNRGLSAAEIQLLFGNQPPIAVEDAYSTDQDTVLNVGAPGVLGNDTDPNGSPVTAIKVGEPAHGTLRLDANGSFTYTPDTGYSGTDTFTYKVSDGSLQSGVASVGIQVNAIPNTPTDAPRVLTVLRANSSPSNASSVAFTVTFSEPVTGVEITDFTLSTVGVTGATLTHVSGTGAMRTVTVNTGLGNGTIRLDVVDNNTIIDGAGNPLGGVNAGDGNFRAGQTYIITKNSTFDDVQSDYWAWSFIERLYSAGITGGCGTSPLQYCPETTVTRSQMAVFLERGIHGSSYSPPAVGAGTGFADVPVDYWSAAWIKQLAAEDITGGCGNGNYCPEYPVTRDQMAVFLLRSKYGSSYSPPAVGISTGFGDVPVDHWAAPWIKQLVTEGITAGCGSGNYCPGAPVSRAQMAVFLVRTFKLP